MVSIAVSKTVDMGSTPVAPAIEIELTPQGVYFISMFRRQDRNPSAHSPVEKEFRRNSAVLSPLYFFNAMTAVKDFRQKIRLLSPIK